MLVLWCTWRLQGAGTKTEQAVAAHKTVSANKLKQGCCHTGCEERRVRSDCFLPVFFLPATQQKRCFGAA